MEAPPIAAPPIMGAPPIAARLILMALPSQELLSAQLQPRLIRLTRLPITDLRAATTPIQLATSRSTPETVRPRAVLGKHSHVPETGAHQQQYQSELAGSGQRKGSSEWQLSTPTRRSPLPLHELPVRGAKQVTVARASNSSPSWLAAPQPIN